MRTIETRCNFLRKDRESQPSFSHEETQHDGTVQSMVNEASPRERPWQPDVDSQRGTWPQQFAVGNDEAELGIQIILKQVNDQVRKRQKRSPMNVTEDEEKHSMIWECS